MNTETEISKLKTRVETLEKELNQLREFIQISEQEVPPPAEAY